MKAIITVIGKDRIGVIGKVCTYLAEHTINILDISQTTIGWAAEDEQTQGGQAAMGGKYLNMAMIVDLAASHTDFDDVAGGLEELGRSMDYVIRIQHEEIFNGMHRI